MGTASRIWRHLNTGSRAVQRAFPAATRDAIEQAIKSAEAAGATDIRFAVEDSLPYLALRRGVTPRQRAVQVFGELGVWDTRHNTGVLIYVLLADRHVEIVADRGAGGGPGPPAEGERGVPQMEAEIVADRGAGGGQVPPAEWERCCREMEAHFGKGDFRAGALAGIAAVAGVLAQHPSPRGGNELPDAPAIL